MESSPDPSHSLIESTLTPDTAIEYSNDREVNLTRLAPVTQQMAYNHISQEFGFPRSY
jgi:hypothetical protein